MRDILWVLLKNSPRTGTMTRGNRVVLGFQTRFTFLEYESKVDKLEGSQC